MKKLKFLATFILAAIGAILLIALGIIAISYPPTESNGQSIRPKVDSTALSPVNMVLFDSLAKMKNSIDSSVVRVEGKIDDLQKKSSKTKIVYKEKKVFIPVKTKPKIIHDTVKIFIPVNKSEYYLEQRRISDSLAVEKVKRDSIDRAWRHRSIFRKILGKAPKVKRHDGNSDK